MKNIYKKTAILQLHINEQSINSLKLKLTRFFVVFDCIRYFRVKEKSFFVV